MRNWTIALFLLTLAPLPAQEKPSPLARTMALLQSEKLVDLAWGGYLANQNKLRAALPLLRKALKKVAAQPAKKRRFAAQAIMDAIIQTGGSIPAADLKPFCHYLTLTPALILLAKSRRTSAAVLQQIIEDSNGPQVGLPWLCAGNLLCAQKAPTFVAYLIKNTSLALEVIVSDNRPIGFGRSSRRVAFSDGVIRVPPGYPPIAFYRLSTRASEALVVGGHRSVYYTRRVYKPGRRGSGGRPVIMDRSLLGLEWLALLMAKKPSTFALQPNRKLYIGWTGAEDFQGKVAAEKKRLSKTFRDICLDLAGKKLLDPKKAPLYEPAIKVTIQDIRKKKSPPLPPLPK